MSSFKILIEQVRIYLIKSENGNQKHKVYNTFINECKANNLSEQDFYLKILKVAYSSIDWEFENKIKASELLELKIKKKQVENELEEMEKKVNLLSSKSNRITRSKKPLVTKVINNDSDLPIINAKVNPSPLKYFIWLTDFNHQIIEIYGTNRKKAILSLFVAVLSIISLIFNLLVILT